MSRARYKPPLGWQDTACWGAFLAVIYVLLAAAPVLLTLVDNLRAGGSAAVQAALAAAMFGFSLVCLQVVLAGRFKTVDRPFGLDVLMRFHKAMGILAVPLLLSHPLLLAWGHQSWRLFSFDMPWQVNLGKATLLVLLLGVIFALCFLKLGVDYNLWRTAHKGMFAVVVLAFLHGMYIGPDIQNGSVRIYWISMFSVVCAVFLYRNLIVPVWIARKFKVSDVRRQTHDTYTLSFEPLDGRPTLRNPGQFMFLRLIRPGRPCETHPFTISASPLETNLLEATIKQSGNFTNTIGRTRAGDTARIEAPFGRFSYVHDAAASILFIAGGIGITPIMSMLRCLRETGDGRPVKLLYGNKAEEDIVFRQEIEELPANFATVHVLSHANDTWRGERGYITTELIGKYADEMLKDAHIYLCGPPVMMDKVIKSLLALKVSGKRIHFERFTI